MLLFVLGLIFAGLVLMSLILLKTYQQVPALELKRLARRGDEVAALFYRPVAYGVSLSMLLWVIVGLSLAASVLLLVDSLPGLVAFVIIVALVWIGFVWIPNGKLSKKGIWLSKKAAPVLAWLLERSQPGFEVIGRLARRYRTITVHTGLYEKSDLAELLQRQKDQPDNRISTGEIELLTHALTFGDKLVVDVLVPKRVVMSVDAKEQIGPKLMDELHKSGHSRFPVYEDKDDNIVGVLYLRDLIATKRSGEVRAVMKRHLSYVHEDYTLYQTLQAFIKTKRHLFLVVNDFEEFSGIITIEDVIEQMTGELIMDEFDNYEDLRAVAVSAAHREHVAHEKADSEPTEVVK